MTKRQARAHSSITVNEIIYQQIIDNTNKKGNVLNTAQIAGIMAAKTRLRLFQCAILYH